MSVRTVLAQKSRPYKIEVYGLQDNYLGTLQSYNDTFMGQIVSPKIKFSDDGSQTFTCSIPKFYIDPETNYKVQNPRWIDVNNGLLAENTRVLKIFLKDSTDQEKVYPFIIDTITDKRDSHFAIYREIEASGLAFAELGKVGYKLELNSDTLEADYAEDNNTVATINYWLDKVFPNVKDSAGKVIKWLTPWCYEIRMDWSSYADENRESTKIYEDSYVGSWGVKEETENTAAQLVSEEIVESLEKARYIDCENSNKYNITQDIAQIFGVFCIYEYKAASNGKFIGEYTDEKGNIWQGRKVIFNNRAIKTENPLVIDYQNNLQTISRTSDSSEIYTKLFITPIESSTMESGYISIANTSVNPLLDEFILNFDYLRNIGSLSDYQASYVNNYQVEIHKTNTKLINLAPSIENTTVELNNAKSEKAATEKEVSSAQEALTNYQTLRDSEVTNTPVIKDKTNSYSVVFVPSGDITQAQIRLQGVAASSIVAYSDYKYTKKIFSGLDLMVVNKVNSVLANDRKFYLVVDEFGFPSSIYTSVNNIAANGGILEKAGTLVYLALEYSPKNAYESICNQLINTINSKTAQLELLENSVNSLTVILDDLNKQQEDLLAYKDTLNQKLELILGPALREGYWTPDSYEDPGQGCKEDVRINQSSNYPRVGSSLFFDKILFEGEERGYYYDSIVGEATQEKKYYSYIDISDLYTQWHNQDKKIENLVIHLLNPSFKYTVVNTPLPAGYYFIYYNSIKYYFRIPVNLPIGTTIEVMVSNNKPIIYINDTARIETVTNSTVSAANLTTLFEGLNSYLGDYLLYNNAGYVFAFITNTSTTVKPVLLLNNTAINYSLYQNLAYSFIGEDTKAINRVISGGPSTAIEMRYPRIGIFQQNVNYDSDNLEIIQYTGTFLEELPRLEKYKDYSLLVRNGYPFFTLKITNDNDIYEIYNSYYRINYQISRANEMLYLDAKQVARDNSWPKYSYSISISNAPDEVKFIELGQLVYINDHSLGTHAATGYVSSIDYDLSQPQNDDFVIQNYKTKFEDLFSTITASSEAMKNNQIAYDIAAGSFTSNGLISGTVLQTTLDNNNISFGFSDTNVTIDNTNGITLTNFQPYMNGVYGQVVLQGGGIFLSSAIDGAGNRIWSTGITPEGINASLITTGQLDTNLIRVFAGDNMAFQWNGEGIFAYRKNDDGTTDLNSYVRYSDKGLQYISADETSVDLGWNGLTINTLNGALSLTGHEGLTIYDGKMNDYKSNVLIRLGRFDEEDGTYDYGLRMYKTTDGGETYTPTLLSSNSGELWLKDSLIVGTPEDFTYEDENFNIITAQNIAGVTGSINGPSAAKSVRFWAGRGENEMQIAPFRVLQDGTLYATEAYIKGEVHATSGSFAGSLEAATGYIGGWAIGETTLSSGNMVLSSATDSENPARICITNDEGEIVYAVYNNGALRATAGKIGNLTIGDIDAMGGDTSVQKVVITASGGTVVKVGEAASVEFTATGYRGNIAFSKIEYSQYYEAIDWQWAETENSETWISLLDKPIEFGLNPNLTFNYNEQLEYSFYVRCVFIGKNGGKSIISNALLLTAALIDIRYSEDGETFTEDVDGQKTGTVLGKYIGFRLVDKIPSTAEELEGTFQDYTWSLKTDVVLSPTYSIVPTVELIYKFKTHQDSLEFSPNRVSFSAYESINNNPYRLDETQYFYYLQLAVSGGQTNSIRYPIDENEYLTLSTEINMAEIYNIIQTDITQMDIVVVKKIPAVNEIDNYYTIISSKTVSVPYGLTDDMAQLQLNATNIVQYIRDTKLTFDANGITLQNGIFEIIDNVGNKLLYADERGNLVVKGTISANSGSIGGWIIEKEELHSVSNNTGMYSGESVTYNNSPIRFYAGKTGETEKSFIVTDDGYLFAHSADITGNIYATSGRITNVFNVGTNGNGIVIYGGDSTNQSFIGSENFSSGTLGYGWRIRSNGSAEFTDIVARGKIQSSVFEFSKTSAIGGSLYITPTIYLDDISSKIQLIDSNYFASWNYPASSFENVCGRKWAPKDELRIEGTVVKRSEENNVESKVDIKSIVAYIDNITPDEDGITSTITISFASNQIDSSLEDYFFIEGTLMMFYGAYNEITDTRQQSGIYLTAVDEDAPFIDIYDISEETTYKPAVRLGNLNGITDSAFEGQGKGGKLSGYGLYSSNAYLTGQLVLPGAGITNETSEALLYKNGTNGYIRLWAGTEKTGAQDAPFVVTSDGSLFASKGVFKGRVEATEGYFSGVVQTLGIVIQEDGVATAPTKGKDHFFVGYSNEPNSFDDYVINIDNKGLSIWEGGLRAYSDAASLNTNGKHTHAIYGYHKNKGEQDFQEHLNPMPFFYLVDDANNITNTSLMLDARVVAYKNHIFQIKEDNERTWNSVLIDNGIWFSNGKASSDSASSNEALEKAAYASHGSTGIYKDGDSLVFKNSGGIYQFNYGIVNINGVLNMISDYGDAAINIGGMSIQQIKVDSTYIGINII